MIFRREIGEKGQVVIPVDIRRMLKLRTGEKVVFEVKGDEVLIKSELSPEEFLKDFLNVPKLKKKLNAKELKEVIMSQYELP
ncbi:MAG TPA: AbrB/MazE/SpoVT family DNA-binding domain-containing protein [Candidatus Nanoarchaeia archaeon]|nr:AbrB/MazE/SpoVT family DNA-binding domain-containing protein [Candidatus Nanoarchaeia archaeon]